MQVLNMSGTEVYYNSAVEMMDNEIREELEREGFETEQEFFTAYEKAHEEKFGEVWELSKGNPVY